MQSLECVRTIFVCFIAKNECARHSKSGFIYVAKTCIDKINVTYIYIYVLI